MATQSKGLPRQRIGRVSSYPHHGNYWLFYRENGQAVRRPAGVCRIVVRDRKTIFIFTPAQEQAFFDRVSVQAFAVHMVLAKTAQRPAELTHGLIDDLDLDGGWWHVRSKPEVGCAPQCGGTLSGSGQPTQGRPDLNRRQESAWPRERCGVWAGAGAGYTLLHVLAQAAV